MAKFLYPCPVLGNEDDYSEEASFTFEKELILNIEEDGVQLTIPKPKINDNEINNYLKNRDLSLFLEIDSPSSFFHKVLEIKFEGDEEFFNILFPYGELNKKVFYTFFHFLFPQRKLASIIIPLSSIFYNLLFVFPSVF